MLRSAAVVLDSADGVVKASPAAYAFGLVRGHDLVHSELRELAVEVRRQGVVRERELELPAARSAGPSSPCWRGWRRWAPSTCWCSSTTAPRPAGSKRCAATSSPTSATS